MLSWSQWLNSAGTLTRGGGTPARGAGTVLRPIPAEFNHCVYNSNNNKIVYSHYYRTESVPDSLEKSTIYCHCFICEMTTYCSVL